MSKPVLLISSQRDLDVIGLKCLHYHLLAHSYQSTLLFLPGYDCGSTSSRASAQIVDFAADLSPLFIGVSLMSVEYRRAACVTRLLKKRLPSVPVVWGGIHPTVAPQTCLDYADYVCIGEGEDAVLKLANALSAGEDQRHVNNLCFREEGQLVHNPLNPLIEDLDDLAPYEHIPTRSFVLDRDTIARLEVKTFRKLARYSGTTYSVISSRGCPFSCTYCCNNALSSIYGSRQVRFRKAQTVVDEIGRAVADHPFIEYVNFQDDCFLARDNEQIEMFCDLYEKEIGKPFVVRSIPMFVTREKVARLRAAGLAWISLGLQSGSDRTCLHVYRRPSTKEDFLRAARLINEFEVAAFYDVILDNPFETDEERLETVCTLTETPKPHYTQFFSLTLYPGTELHERALSEGAITGGEYLMKDYFKYKNTPVNNLTRLAAFLSPWWVRRLVRLYRSNPHSLTFKMNMLMARLFAIVFSEPVTYLKVVRLSQNGSLRRTLRVLPHLLHEGLTRFWHQFASSPGRHDATR